MLGTDRQRPFSSLGLTATANRGLVVALGCFGARALAHLWARMRFEDAQRQALDSELPSLRKTVKYDLLLPMANGGFVAGPPNSDPDYWDDDHFIRRVSRLRPVSLEVLDQDEASDPNRQLYEQELTDSLVPSSLLRVDGRAEDGTREAYLETVVNSTQILGDHFVQLTDWARVDQDAPGREENRLSVYVIVALHEGPASALLWPVVMTLRERLETYLPVEFIGLLSVGAYGDQKERQVEGATIHAALRELEFFSCVEPQVVPDRLPGKAPEWLGSPFFDRCFLLDSEKHNVTRPVGEDEIVVAIGNALETLLTSEAPEKIDAYLGPDDQVLKREGAFSTLGASSVYIPIDKWREIDRDKFVLNALRSQFLTPSADTPQRIRDQASRLDHVISLERLTRQMIRDCPFVPLVSERRGLAAAGLGRRFAAWVRKALRRGATHEPARLGPIPPVPQREREPGRRWARGKVGLLLRDSGQIQPLLGRGPSMPLLQVRVDMNRPETRIDYTERDPVTGRRRRLDSQEWLPYLYRRFRELGLELEPIADDDPPIAETQARRWCEKMTLACDSSQVETSDLPADIPLLSITTEEAQGIIPESSRFLQSQLAEILSNDNQGVLIACGIVEELNRQLPERVEQVKDYRMRLARAMRSDAGRRIEQDGRHRRLHFERLLAGQPGLPGLLSRGWMLAALAAGLLYHGLPLLEIPLLTFLLPLWSLLGGGIIAATSGWLIWLNHRRRLRHAIRAVQNNLTRQLDILANYHVAQLMIYQEAGRPGNGGLAGAQSTAEPPAQLAGLLPNVELLLHNISQVIHNAHQRLQRNARDLEVRISEPFGIDPPFLRRPLPGLDEIRQQLEEQARASGGSEEIPLQLLAADPVLAGDELPAILGRDLGYLANGSDPRHAGEQVQAIDRGGSAGRKARYFSVSDLIQTAIRRLADRTLAPIQPPAGLRIEPLIRERIPVMQAFLNDLRLRTNPMLRWDSEELADGMPIQLEWLSLEEAGDSPELAGLAQQMGIHPVSSLDPFAITFVKLVTGLRIQSIPHFGLYAEDFRQIGLEARMRLVVVPRALTRVGEYLASKGGG